MGKNPQEGSPVLYSNQCRALLDPKVLEFINYSRQFPTCPLGHSGVKLGEASGSTVRCKAHGRLANSLAEKSRLGASSGTASCCCCCTPAPASLPGSKYTSPPGRRVVKGCCRNLYFSSRSTYILLIEDARQEEKNKKSIASCFPGANCLLCLLQLA